jgi:prevent-host-death family protein
MAEPDVLPPPAPKRVGIREFRGNFSGFMRQVRQGASFVVTSRDEVVAIIQPPDRPARQPRQPGTLRGKIRMSPDFDTLPPDILATLVGDFD